MMGFVIEPFLLRVNEDHRWQESERLPFGSSPHERWVIHFEVVLADRVSQRQLDKSFIKRIKSRHPHVFNSEFNKDGQLGELFGVTVCSPAFKDNPTSDYTPESARRALVQPAFNEDQALAFLTATLDAIGEVDVEEAGSHFRKFLDTDEWDDLNGVEAR